MWDLLVKVSRTQAVFSSTAYTQVLASFAKVPFYCLRLSRGRTPYQASESDVFISCPHRFPSWTDWIFQIKRAPDRLHLWTDRIFQKKEKKKKKKKKKKKNRADCQHSETRSKHGPVSCLCAVPFKSLCVFGSWMLLKGRLRLFKRGNVIHPFVVRWIQTNLYMVLCWAQMFFKIKLYCCNLMIHVVSMIIVRSV